MTDQQTVKRIEFIKRRLRANGFIEVEGFHLSEGKFIKELIGKLVFTVEIYAKSIYIGSSITAQERILYTQSFKPFYDFLKLSDHPITKINSITEQIEAFRNSKNISPGNECLIKMWERSIERCLLNHNIIH